LNLQTGGLLAQSHQVQRCWYRRKRRTGVPGTANREIHDLSSQTFHSKSHQAQEECQTSLSQAIWVKQPQIFRPSLRYNLKIEIDGGRAYQSISFVVAQPPRLMSSLRHLPLIICDGNGTRSNFNGAVLHFLPCK